ncbi:hypothetical protein [Nocardia macrotermitis]|uniref:hypothetical protein n=1 Tax=Nocardia macrotermitis TaxID=2585198 RepID=UPI0012975685|nr:hypothetical protein [Nocardia macrotermitis]
MRFLAVVALCGACFLVPGTYGQAAVYLTGERVSATIDHCALMGEKRHFGYHCAATWRYRDAVRSGDIHGIRDDRRPGAAVAVRADADTAVTDSPGWLVWFSIGVSAALVLVVLIVRLFLRLIRATAPESPSGTTRS